MNTKQWSGFLGISALVIALAFLVDQWFLPLIPLLRIPVLDSLFTFIGSSLGLVVFFFIVGVLLLWKDRQKILYFMAAVLTALAASYLLKYALMRPRPDILPLLIKSSPSFPSTHAAVAGSVYFFARKLGRMEKSVVLLLGILVAVSGFYNGVHYLSDIVAGIVLGLIIGYVSEAKLPGWIAHKDKKTLRN